MISASLRKVSISLPSVRFASQRRNEQPKWQVVFSLTAEADSGSRMGSDEKGELNLDAQCPCRPTQGLAAAP